MGRAGESGVGAALCRRGPKSGAAWARGIRRGSWFLALALLFPVALRADKESSHARPDPARFAKDIAAFDEAWKADSSTTGGIVFTGSSSVRLWDVKKAFPDLPVLNRGFGGSVSNDLNVYAERVALRYKPKVLVVYTGSNDLHAKLEPAEVMDDYSKFLTLVHSTLPDTRVVVSSVKYAPSRVAELENVKKLNTLLASWCRDKPWIHWVEASAYLLGSDGQPIESLYRADRLHLNDEGYAKWNAIIGPVIREAWTRTSP